VEIRGATTVAGGTTLSLNGTLNMPSAVALTVNGTVIVYGDVALTDGSIAGSGAVEARANVTQASTYDGGLGNLRINGSGNQTFTGSATTAAGDLAQHYDRQTLRHADAFGDAADRDGELDLCDGSGRRRDELDGLQRCSDDHRVARLLPG